MRMVSIHEMCESHAAIHPCLCAVEADGQSISYSELNRRANQLARRLRELGITAESVVGVCMERSIDYFIAILAVLKAGGAFIPLSKTQPVERLSYILKDTNAPAVIVNETIDHLFTQFAGTVINLPKEQNHLQQLEDTNLNLAIAKEQLAYIIYTSGSTGVPKGVLIEHHSLVNYTIWFEQVCHLKSQQRVDFSCNHIFDLAITVSLCPIMLGLTVVVCPDSIKKSPRHYLEFIRQTQVQFIKLTPAYLRVLLHEIDNHPIALPHLEMMMTGGEMLMADDCRKWFDSFPNQAIFNEYGPTEATVGASILEMDKNQLQPHAKAPIDNAGPGMVFYILDEKGREVPKGQVGELHIGGVCLARCYHNQPDKTAEKFIANPLEDAKYPRLYKTGDLFRQLDDHHFEYLGRMDHQVKIRGYRVEPDEVANVLMEYAEVRQAAVISVENQLGEMELAAYLVPTSEKAVTKDEIKQKLAAKLPDYMIPSTITFMSSMPMNANGKLDRKALPQITAQQHANYAAPKNHDESALCAIWEKELKLDKIGIHDNFFALGGHSLSAARILSDINASMNKDISFNDFYQNPTITSMAKKLKPLKSQPLMHKTEHNKLPALSDFQLIFWLSALFRPGLKKINMVSCKRFNGTLDLDRFQHALQQVIQAHDSFRYCTRKITPNLALKKADFNLNVENLADCAAYQKELVLNQSHQQLIQHYPWVNHEPNLLVRVFMLDVTQFEIHLCMPHILSDEVSLEILWQALSHHYLNPKPGVKSSSASYEQYLNEQHHLQQQTVHEDIRFWKEYLADASLLAIPEKYIISDMKRRKLAYSTYLQISESALDKFYAFCREKQISTHYGLCAVAMLAIKRCLLSETQPDKAIYLNLVKSTRHKAIYDRVIGCFLRTDGLKIPLAATDSLLEIAQAMQKSNLDTAAFQHCASLIKLSNINNFRKNQSLLKNITRLLIGVYGRLFKVDKSVSSVIRECASMLAHPYKNNFLLNINIQSSFFNPTSTPSLFNSIAIKGCEPKQDLLQVDNCLDLSFVKRDQQQQPCMVISANLLPEVRLGIAEEMLNIIHQNGLVQELLQREDEIEQLS